ncbi:hypothetical protein [Pedobacter sp. Bi36]|uniref:hypothetical protein n=1 Tax=Pedobacter sp. Bi36 TaxID=2822352 RepID=UPI001E429FF1|nr:hypothetical protein [Pedobacter sp. Bi36]
MIILCSGKELTDEILEYGLSGQKLNVNGTSPRVAQKNRTKYYNDPTVYGINPQRRKRAC